MSPILGILASANYPRSVASYESIFTVNVGSGGSSTVEFTSIPSTYQHLQIRMIMRDGQAGTGFNNNIIRFNNDTGTNYSSHMVYGDGSVDDSIGYGNVTSVNLGFYTPASGNASGIFGAAIVDILDYADTNKYKTTRTLSGGDANGSGIILLGSGNWRNTNAISSIQLSGATYSQYSSFALYGIKG